MGSFLGKLIEIGSTLPPAKEEVEEKRQEKVGNKKKSSRGKIWLWFLVIFLFLLALIPRLYFIFFVSNPDNPGVGWFGDAYHHWQIAYLTREIGLKQGFLRLWDLKGMEYFWGLLHPLMTMLAFWLSGGVSIGSERTITAVFCSLAVPLIFLIVKRFWNTKAAFAAALFAALNPVGVFNDGAGMVESLGIPFLLLGVLFWPKKPAYSGISLMIALMSRAEYWVFSAGLVIAMIIFSRKASFDKKVILFISFLIPLVLYMKYLLNHTSNPIYPFYWNYAANIAGAWQFKPALTPEDIQAKYIFLSIFIASVLFSLLVLVGRPKGMFLYLLGLGNWMFLGATFGLGEYIKSYASYVWYVRFMILPYAFLGMTLAIFLFYFLPKLRGIKILDKLQITWLFFLVVLIAVQAFWIPIWNKYQTTEPDWKEAVEMTRKISQNYRGGGLLLIEGNPEITYLLVVNHGVQGKDIVSQMYDPYFYFPEDEDPYLDWGEKRKIVLNWLKEFNIRTIVTYGYRMRYSQLVKKESQFFSPGVSLPHSELIIYQVNDGLYQTEI
jgi:hypothetical protein